MGSGGTTEGGQSGATGANLATIAAVAAAGYLATRISLAPASPDFRVQIAVALLAAAAAGMFALVLVLRPSRVPAARHLALTMGLVALGIVGAMRPEFPAPVSNWLSGASRLETFVLAAFALAGAAFARFAISFPRALDIEDLLSDRGVVIRTDRDSSVSSVSRMMLDRTPDAFERLTRAMARRIVQLLPVSDARKASWAVKVDAPTYQPPKWLLTLPWHAWKIGALSVVLAMGCAVLGVQHGLLIALAGVGILWASGFVVVIDGYRLLSEGELRKAAWVINGLSLAFVLSLTVGHAGLVIAATLTFLDPQPAGQLGSLSGVVLLHAIFAADDVFALTLIVTLAIAVFKDGALDPALAFRTTALYGVLIMLLGLLFMLIEGLVYALAVAHLELPAGMGPAVGGAGVALTFGPLRRFVDRRVSRWLQRLMPATALADARRREAAVVFSDLTGYTAISAADETAALKLAGLFHKEADKAARNHGGRLVKTIGDAVLMEFSATRDALAAADELRSRFRSASEALELPQTPVRTGVHVGEVVCAHDGDLYGAVVNLAARLETSAAPGEIVMSRAVADSANGLESRLEPLGERSFKNVPQPVECFRLASLAT